MNKPDSCAAPAARGTDPAPRLRTPAPVRALPSAELLQGSRWVEITHNGQIYRLQATRLGKLILTK